MTYIPVFSLKLVRESSVRFEDRPTVLKPQEAEKILRPFVEDRPQEALAVLALDRRSRVIGISVLVRGDHASCHVPVQQIAQFALLCGAQSVILAHNHPSGDPQPSPEDLKTTKDLKAALKPLDIAVLDHIVIGEHGRYESIEPLL